MLVTINYFTKYVEAASHPKITSKHVVKFLSIILYVDI